MRKSAFIFTQKHAGHKMKISQLILSVSAVLIFTISLTFSGCTFFVGSENNDKSMIIYHIEVKDTLHLEDVIHIPKIYNSSGEVYNETAKKSIYKWNSLSGYREKLTVQSDWLEDNIPFLQIVTIVQSERDTMFKHVFKIQNLSYSKSREIKRKAQLIRIQDTVN